MRIKVNKNCIINQENIAKSRDRDIAINITCADGVEDSGFINYTLGIDDYQQCCENFGVIFDKVSNDTYVTYIDHNSDSNEELIQKYLLDRVDDISDLYYTYTIVYGINNKIIAIGICFNEHNGYYSHDVYADINGKIEVDCI